MHVFAHEIDIMKLRTHLDPVVEARRRYADRSWIFAAHGVLVESAPVEHHSKLECKVFWHVLELHAAFVVEEKPADTAATNSTRAVAWNSRSYLLHGIGCDWWNLRRFDDFFLRAFVPSFAH